ncbi:MAG: IPT/TIG domain-containing protein, partial [Opitutaceae bacterium]
MKKFLLASFFSLALGSVAQAQWQNITYSLKAGWNSIYLHGDANHDTIDNILVGSPAVQEVWRWNPNPNPAQFRTSSMLPTASTPEWSVWIRGNSAQTTLSSLLGQTAYLVKCSAPATYTGTIPAEVVNGTYSLNVSFAGGTSLTWGNLVVDRNATSSTPSIVALSSNLVGGGGQFTISGVNFPTSGTTVITLVNGATTVATLSTGIAGSATATQITATVPSGTSTGTFTLKVAFASGVTLDWNNFTVGTTAPTVPLITSVTPSPIVSGALLTFSGINFPAGITPVATLVNSSGATVATISGVSAATAYQLTIPQRILPPRSIWMRGSANFLGFPALAGTD